MRLIAAILGISILLQPAASAQEKSALAFAAASKVAAEKLRQDTTREMETIVQIVKDISDNKNVRLRPRNGPRGDDNILVFVDMDRVWTLSVTNRKGVREEIEKQKERYFALKKSRSELSGYSTPKINLYELGVGDIGVPDNDGKSIRMEVTQVLGKDRALVKAGDTSFIYEGQDLSAIADGDSIVASTVCSCDRTESFTTVIGGTRTVPVLRAWSKAEFEQALNYIKEHPIEQTSTTRKWRDASGGFEVEAELVKSDRGKVTLRKVDGSEITIPLTKLSEADRSFVKENGDPW